MASNQRCLFHLPNGWLDKSAVLDVYRASASLNFQAPLPHGRTYEVQHKTGINSRWLRHSEWVAEGSRTQSAS
jgi:hypothetical protein